MKFALALVALLALVSTGFAQPAPEAALDTLAGLVSSNSNFSILLAAAKSNGVNLDELAMQAGGLVDELSSPDEKLTVFAPTNAAFEALLAAEDLTAEELLGNLDLLRLILGYHVVKGEVLSSDLSNGQVIDTLIPATLTVLIDDMGVFIVPGGGEPAKVIGADVLASNGVVHIIDKVLIPPTPGAAPAAE